ncbi:ABC transporter ATP-binding protein [Erwinia phyllosphaerae]|uniref:ABC transporter ATP-binding protein n=1 Tax=Erwinia phyllosphaerae TaxID=2853256 RepID=UPI001FEDDD5C|nr:ABC transporter ATP-binding protein [Erwinia phyllosphaerae]MBV4366716.1 ABC transporter ATP-binding protein [Erwinia phyllosphaerae]
MSRDVGVNIAIENVSHHFTLEGSELAVLENINLQVEAGEFVALLGPSGCGKSTLLRLLAGLEQPATGALVEEGQAITAPHPSRVVVFQDPTLYPWRTVYDNVGLGLQIRGESKKAAEGQIHAMLDRVGLREFARAWPHQLSGGMAQRAALARALINHPRLLILDEPLGKLDSLTRLRMQQEIVDLWQEKRFTTLMVTHDVEEALIMANRVVVFSPRPARVLDIITVNSAYPRRRDDALLIALRSRILALLEHDRAVA